MAAFFIGVTIGFVLGYILKGIEKKRAKYHDVKQVVP